MATNEFSFKYNLFDICNRQASLIALTSSPIAEAE